MTKPRSKPRQRRRPRTRIQPDAKPVLQSPKRRSQGEPNADGGAITSAFEKSSRGRGRGPTDRVATSRVPAVDRQREGRLGDEHVTRHHLERLAAGVALALVVARDHPALAARL